MKRIFLMVIGLSALLLAEENVGDSWAVTTDVSYSRYNLDLQGSSHMKAIAYDVSEGTVAISRTTAPWTYGLSYRGIVDEISTNSSIPRTGGKDRATIDRDELFFSLSYLFDIENFTNILFAKSEHREEVGQERVSLNMILYNSSLNAYNQFDIGNSFKQTYKYDTQGAKLSLHYKLTPNNDIYKFWLFGGLLYTHADLKFDEYENGSLRPRYVDSSADEFGGNLGFAFTYDINRNMVFKLIGDWYNVDFGEVDVYSRSTEQVVDTAKFQETASSIRMGVAYKF